MYEVVYYDKIPTDKKRPLPEAGEPPTPDPKKNGVVATTKKTKIERSPNFEKRANISKQQQPLDRVPFARALLPPKEKSVSHHPAVCTGHTVDRKWGVLR